MQAQTRDVLGKADNAEFRRGFHMSLVSFDGSHPYGTRMQMAVH
jgi:hypothetical protein